MTRAPVPHAKRVKARGLILTWVHTLCPPLYTTLIVQVTVFEPAL